jgi:hypothetical protein
LSAWLDPLRAALHDATEPVDVFFRDDDAGWDDPALQALLDVFEAAEAPVDLAAIPLAVSGRLGRELAARHRAAPELVRVHQHGFAHRNHEPTGRKCEFGPSRPFELQLDDVVCGRSLLRRLDVELDPIFTPPWNRCTPDTARAVRIAGLALLSREARAEPLAVPELPVNVDWTKREALPGTLAAAVRDGGPVGVMLHHAVMGADDRVRLAELLALLDAASGVRLATMRALAGLDVAAPAT